MSTPGHPVTNVPLPNKHSDKDRFSAPYDEGLTRNLDPQAGYGRRGMHTIASYTTKLVELMRRLLNRCEESELVNLCIDRGGWTLLAPYAIGVILFLIGWFLSAEALKVFWLLLSGGLAVAGLVWLVMVNLIIRDRSKEGSNQ